MKIDEVIDKLNKEYYGVIFVPSHHNRIFVWYKQGFIETYEKVPEEFDGFVLIKRGLHQRCGC